MHCNSAHRGCVSALKGGAHAPRRAASRALRTADKLDTQDWRAVAATVHRVGMCLANDSALNPRWIVYEPSMLTTASTATRPTRPTRPGKVWLIGAGPGDPELLTLKAVRALAQADVILLDDLVDDAVLAHARPGARVVRVGKRGGCKSTPQAFIERLMLRSARAGHTVARVKGGDPFVFGRGGEEMLALRAAGIEVEVVSGITAGIAAPAALGIPVTHRDVARGVTFITGHTHDGTPPNWQALAAGGTTLVIYMGMRHLAQICTALQAGGMRADMPAAVIESGTRATQRQVASTLSALAADANAARLASPAIIVIGAVAALAQGAALAPRLAPSPRSPPASLIAVLPASPAAPRVLRAA